MASFVLGVPQMVSDLSGAGDILALSRNGMFFAAIKLTHLHILYMHPNGTLVPIGAYEQTTEENQQYGNHSSQVVWHSSTRISVVMTDGKLAQYRISGPKPKLSTELHDIQNVEVVLKDVKDLFSSFLPTAMTNQCLPGEKVMIGFSDGSLRLLDKKMKLPTMIKLNLSEPDDSSSVVNISASNDGQAVGLVLNNGKAVIGTLKGTTDDVILDSKYFEDPLNENMTYSCTSVSNNGRYICFGDVTGSAVVSRITSSGLEVIFRVSPPFDYDVGYVSCLAFNDVSSMLAVTWKSRGISCFQVPSGALCMNTISDVNSHSVWNATGYSEALWSDSGHTLLTIPTFVHGSHLNSDPALHHDVSSTPPNPHIDLPNEIQEPSMLTNPSLICFGFMHGLNTEHHNQGDTLLLKGPDRVIAINHGGAQLEPTAQHVMLPSKIMASEHKTRIAMPQAGCTSYYQSVSKEHGPENRFLAVTTDELATYDFAENTWIFSPEQSECLTFAWFRDFIVIYATKNEFECVLKFVLCLAGRSFSLDTPLLEVSFGSAVPTMIVTNDDYVAVLTTESTLVLYKVACNISSSEVKIVPYGPLLTVTLDNANPLKSLSILPSNVFPDFPKRPDTTQAPQGIENKEKLPRFLVMREDGTLSILAGRRGREQILHRDVDEVFIKNAAPSHQSICVYSKRRVQFLLPTVGNEPESQELGDGVAVGAELKLDFVPLGYQNGTVTGLVQTISQPSNGLARRFMLMVRSQPFLPSLFVYFLNLDGDAASNVATEFSEGPHRGHFMELVLHQILEGPSHDESVSPLLTKAVSILKHYDRFPTAVAGCARTSDRSLWPLLFSVAGAPESLFDQTLESGDLLAASALIPVLRAGRLNGSEEGTDRVWLREWARRGLALLVALLATGDMKSASDLLRHLLTHSTFELAEIEKARGGSILRDSVCIDDTHFDLDIRYAVDCILGYRATELLQDGAMPELVVLSVELQRWFPLETWISRHWKDLKEQMAHNFSRSTQNIRFTIAAMHTAFANFAREQSRDEELEDDRSEPLKSRLVDTAQAELEHLFRIFSTSRAHEWAIAASSILRRPSATARLIRSLAESEIAESHDSTLVSPSKRRQQRSVQIWHEYKSIMEEYGSYDTFLEGVESTLGIEK